MGKFALRELGEKLRFHANIFGKTPFEQSLEVTAKDKIQGKQQTFALTPNLPTAELFP